ncbi:flagellar protein FlgN [Escherichia coli]|nr:flagellar protein FlgN [Escherichia coli]
MSIRLQQVKALLQGIRDDDALYDSLRELLQRQRICMIRRASEELLAVNDEITHHYEQLHGHSHQRHSLLKMLGVSVNRDGLAQVFAPGFRRYKKRQHNSCGNALSKKRNAAKPTTTKNGDLLIRQYEFIQSFFRQRSRFSVSGITRTPSP